MNRGVNRADHLAGRVLAMHAGHRLEVAARGSSGSPVVVAVDAQPMHLASARDLILARHRDVVLRLAGDDAGIAADAEVEIDHHAPGVAVDQLPGRQALVRIRDKMSAGLCAAGCADLAGDFAHEVATIHAMMCLRGGDWIAAAGARDAAAPASQAVSLGQTQKRHSRTPTAISPPARRP